MTFIKKFESIKKKVGAFDASAIQEKIAMHVNMTDEDCGGAFYIETENGVLNVEPYDYRDHTVMITLKAADLVSLVDKKSTLDVLASNGKVFVEGDYSHAQKIFELKKPAAKRTTKKTVAKKSEEKPAAKAEEKKTVKRSAKTTEAKATKKQEK